QLAMLNVAGGPYRFPPAPDSIPPAFAPPPLLQLHVSPTAHMRPMLPLCLRHIESTMRSSIPSDRVRQELDCEEPSGSDPLLSLADSMENRPCLVAYPAAARRLWTRTKEA